MAPSIVIAAWVAGSFPLAMLVGSAMRYFGRCDGVESPGAGGPAEQMRVGSTAAEPAHQKAA